MRRLSLAVVLTSILGTLLGLWDTCGGGFATLGSLLPQTPVEHPMLNHAQNVQFLAFQMDMAVYQPVEAALSVLSLAAGMGLVVGGISILLWRVRVGGLIGASVFGAGVAVNGLQVAWFVLKTAMFWTPMVELLHGVVDAQPGRTPPGIDTIVTSSLLIGALVVVAYYVVKIGICVLGVQVSLRRDRELVLLERSDSAEPGFEAPGHG
ncbi:MAG: hypothetical protein ACI9MC_002311 [Kiritimatiellia bacterium]